MKKHPLFYVGITLAIIGFSSAGYVIFNFINMANASYPAYEYIPIDYLEYSVTIYFRDVNDFDTRIVSEFPVSPFSKGETLTGYTVTNSPNEKSSRMIQAIYNDKPYFSISFWQETETGLIPVSGYCLNESICFDEIKPVIYVIKELQPNVKILDDEISLRNQRVTDIIRVNDNTVNVTVSSNAIMPKEEWNHHMLPSLVLFIPFEFTEESISQQNSINVREN